MPPPIVKDGRVFNKQERELINPFKELYMKTTTPSERKVIAQAHIFPKLFNYWSSIGVDITPEENNKRSEVSG